MTYPLLPPSPPRKRWRIWHSDERKLLAGMLAALGDEAADLTEVSDVRELLGLPRLSEAPPNEPIWVVLWVATDEGQRLLSLIRELRKDAIEAVLSLTEDARQEARRLEKIKSSSPKTWRLRELERVFAQGRIIEIWREEQCSHR